MCAPQTATRTVAGTGAGLALPAGRVTPVAPMVVTMARCASPPSLHSPASVKARENSVIPNGWPFG